MPFSNRVVLVTGSTRGIGRGIAEAFYARGADVVILGRSEERVKQVCETIDPTGERITGYPCDVCDRDAVTTTVNKILDTKRRLDILINNAGVTKDNLLLRMSDDDFMKVIDVNLRGAFYFTKAAAKPMIKQRWGRIINISSIIGLIGNAGQANYAASKAGLIGLTKSAAKELGSRGITVNAIAPGYIETDMTESLKPEQKKELLHRIPVGRFGTTEDVAHLCLFLASDEAAYITGQTFKVDGGLVI